MSVVATDDFSGRSIGLDSPPRKWVAVTKSDTDQLVKVCRCLYIGGTGDVAVLGADDTVSVIFSAVPAGTELSGMFKQVLSTGTTATLILAGY